MKEGNGDIDTLIVYCNIDKIEGKIEGEIMPIESIEHRREKAKSCVEELHVQKFWINTKRF
jgi:hypothetical protein